jgi:hypothetical protein
MNGTHCQIGDKEYAMILKSTSWAVSKAREIRHGEVEVKFIVSDGRLLRVDTHIRETKKID